RVPSWWTTSLATRSSHTSACGVPTAFTKPSTPPSTLIVGVPCRTNAEAMNTLGWKTERTMALSPARMPSKSRLVTARMASRSGACCAASGAATARDATRRAARRSVIMLRIPGLRVRDVREPSGPGFRRGQHPDHRLELGDVEAGAIRQARTKMNLPDAGPLHQAGGMIGADPAAGEDRHRGPESLDQPAQRVGARQRGRRPARGE